MATTKKAVKAKDVPAAEAIVQGSMVRFLGYGDNVPDDEQLLEKDSEHEVLEVTKSDEGDTVYVVSIDNPDFDSKKKENDKTNPKMIETEVLGEEVELISDTAESADSKEEAAPAPAKRAPKVTPKSAPTVKGGKAATKAPAVKGKAVKVAKPPKAAKPPKEVVVEEEMPDLEGEDEEVLAIIADSENLIETAQDLETEVGRNEYRLGGVLFHIKKDKTYQELDAAFAEKGGWAKFLEGHMNIGYRKAQNLIDIYVSFTQAQIEDPAGKVASMGWAKAAKITALLLEDGQNPEELVTLASESTLAELSESISVQKTSVGGVKGEAKKRTIIRLSYFEDEGAAIGDILTAAMEQHGMKKIEEAFAMIVNEWAATSAGGEQADETDAPVQTAPVGSAKSRTASATKSASKPVAKTRSAA